MIEIKNRFTGAVIRTVDAADLTGAYLTGANLAGADLAGADLTDANLTGAYLAGANLAGADLRGAYLTGAYLRDADLTGADLTGADLQNTTMPGFPGAEPVTSLADAARRTREWLAEGRWMRGKWISTPTAAYAGDCLACLHGAAVYVGGPGYGPRLSQALIERGYDVAWNDVPTRTLPEVLAALDEVAGAAEVGR